MAYPGSGGYDRELRQMSHFFDVKDLEANRLEAKRKAAELQRNVDWKKASQEVGG
jgi:hypothetical protein